MSETPPKRSYFGELCRRDFHMLVAVPVVTPTTVAMAFHSYFAGGRFAAKRIQARGSFSTVSLAMEFRGSQWPGVRLSQFLMDSMSGYALSDRQHTHSPREDFQPERLTNRPHLDTVRREDHQRDHPAKRAEAAKG